MRARWQVLEKILGVLGRYFLERARRLREIEAVAGRRVCSPVAGGQAREAELVLDELQDAALLVLNVRHVALFRVR